MDSEKKLISDPIPYQKWRLESIYSSVDNIEKLMLILIFGMVMSLSITAGILVYLYEIVHI